MSENEMSTAWQIAYQVKQLNYGKNLFKLEPHGKKK